MRVYLVCYKDQETGDWLPDPHSEIAFYPSAAINRRIVLNGRKVDADPLKRPYEVCQAKLTIEPPERNER